MHIYKYTYFISRNTIFERNITDKIIPDDMKPDLDCCHIP